MNLNKYYYYVFKFIFLFIILNNSINHFEKNEFLSEIIFKKKCRLPIINSINTLFVSDIKKNSILIIEPFNYHYECTPGFSKYFIDLGYNIDILMSKVGITSLCFFENTEKIRLFIYDKIDDLKNFSEFYSIIFNKYNHILIETTDPKVSQLIQDINIINIYHSIFVFHHIDYMNLFSFTKHLKKNQIWSLGNFSLSTQVNPHYFGNFKIKKKNRITKFFITSTINRNYQLLVSAAEKIKDENLKFHVIVVGKWKKAFTKNNIPEKLKKNFTFKYKISYLELFIEVIDSDFIIINLDPDNTEDNEFKNIRVTGSAQLAYGFLKPVIINKEFAGIYNFNSFNSFIYENSNFFEIMKNAINQKNKYYKLMQQQLSITSNKIYNISLYNVKKSLTNS